MILFKDIFWGIVFLVFGIFIILSTFLNFYFPFFRIIVALFIIYIGIKMLIDISPRTKHFIKNDEETIVFSKTESKQFSFRTKYNFVFSKNTIDFSEVKADNINKKNIEINVVFGSTLLIFNKNTPIDIKADVFLSNVDFPNKNKIVLGKCTYNTPASDSSFKSIKIHANVVFGELIIKEKE